MENVGQLLSSHASALDSAVSSLIKSAIVADTYAKDCAIERTRQLLQAPPSVFEQYILYEAPGTGGTPEKRLLRFELLVPTFIFANNEPLVITKYTIASTFEAHIKKSLGVSSTTAMKGGVSSGFLGIPKFNFDISTSVTVDHNSESDQRNTFDLSIEMGQGQHAVGYVEVVKAFTRTINTIVDFICNESLDNPRPVSESEAQQLHEAANVPITDVSTTNDEAIAQPQQQPDAN